MRIERLPAVAKIEVGMWVLENERASKLINFLCSRSELNCRTELSQGRVFRPAPASALLSEQYSADGGAIQSPPRVAYCRKFRQLQAPVISDPLFYLLAIPAVTFLGLGKGGFAGLGIVAAPLLALVMPPLQAAAILLPILIVQARFRSTFIDTTGARGTSRFC